MSRMPDRAVALAIVLCAVLLAGSAGSATEPALAPGEVVLYSSDVDDPNPLPPIGFPVAPGKSVDLYLASDEGTVRLTNAFGNNQFAVWSPDGETIAFESGQPIFFND